MLYRFHALAKEQQLVIWHTTYQHWGEQQADRYIEGLHAKLAIACEDASILRLLPKEIHESIQFFRYQRHYVFVKATPPPFQQKLDVLALLHDRMDISHQLREALDRLDEFNDLL